MEQQLVKIWVKVKAGSTSQYEEHLQPFRKNFIVIGKKPVIDTKPLYDEQSISPVPLSRSIQHSHSLATGGTLDYILFSRSHVQPTIIIYEVVFQIRPKSARRLFSSFIGSHRIFCDIYIYIYMYISQLTLSVEFMKPESCAMGRVFLYGPGNARSLREKFSKAEVGGALSPHWITI